MNKLMNVLILTALLCLNIAGPSHAEEVNPPSRRWIDRPWEIRYLLFVNTQQRFTEAYRLARLQNTSDGKNGKRYVYWDAMELIPKAATFATPGTPSIAVGLVTFDAQGRVTSSDERLRGFTAKLSALGDLVLIRNSTPSAKPYELLHWSQGIPGNLSFGPSPCTMLDILRYQDEWKSGGYPGDFGCREWTAQLFDDERPYVDVTTYTRRGNFIGEFVGWSRINDGAKPVIGMNGKTWLCLHDCPAGEKSGVIANINTWTREHGYPMPKKPRHQPEYPNRDYYDDLHEFNEDE
jgi:hypothetical protein